MKLIALAFLLMFVFSCQIRDKKPQRIVLYHGYDEIIEKKTRYCDMGKAFGEMLSWNFSECDSLLYASLWGIACEKIPIEDFEGHPGKWYRTTKKDCFIPPNTRNGSKSTISNDMLLGLMHYLWHTRDKANLIEIAAYGKANDWVMGESEGSTEAKSRVVMSYNLINLLHDMLSSPDRFDVVVHDSVRALITNPFGTNVGYRAHLEVLRILLEARVYGAITASDKDVLKRHANRQPDNALYQLAYALFQSNHGLDRTVDLLLGNNFPPYTLPTNLNHCTPYLFSHDKDNNDWEPCPDRPAVFPGIDYVFAVSILDGTIIN